MEECKEDIKEPEKERNLEDEENPEDEEDDLETGEDY